MNSVKLRVYKDKFNFSSAHFLIFDEKSAERLHGHNYMVRMEVEAPASNINPNKAFLLDFNELKVELKKLVDAWDEMVLLPGNQPEMNFEVQESSLHVRFRDRYYVFPVNEVIRLPIVNTSVEALSELLAHKMADLFPHLNFKALTIEVEESYGQSASYTLFK